MTSLTFSVLTPTFNRAHTLARVHDALRAQTLRDFEWIIVDDGSTDGTESLVESWIALGEVRIKYRHKSNGGKHTAYNLALDLAEGEFGIVLDSDDACTTDALETLRAAWLSIPESQRDAFSGVSCFCRKEPAETTSGTRPQIPVTDGHAHELIDVLGLHMEMWGMHRLAVLRAHRFPEYAGERFCPEGLVWNRISSRLKTRLIPDALRLYFSSDDSLSSRSVAIRRNNPRGTADYYHELIQLKPQPGNVFRCAVNLHRFEGWRHRTGRLWLSPNTLPAYVLGALVGTAVHLRDRMIRRGPRGQA